MSAKQDRAAPRTAADIDRKYKSAKSFAEQIGLTSEFRDYVNDSISEIAYGEWTPTVANAVSYSGQRGWYQKVGKVITIGWNIIAAIPGGHHASQITVTGCPFIPGTPTYGAGVVDDAVKWWHIGEDGTITAECYYYENSRTVTMAGTICFITS